MLYFEKATDRMSARKLVNQSVPAVATRMVPFFPSLSKPPLNLPDTNWGWEGTWGGRGEDGGEGRGSRKQTDVSVSTAPLVE